MKTFPPDEFIHSCSYRYDSAGKPCCGIVTKHTGFDAEILPKQCAQCQYSEGRPSMDFATHRSLNVFLELMDYVLLGFYDEATILEIFENFHRLIEEVSPSMSLSNHIKASCSQKLSNTLEQTYSRNLVHPQKLEHFIKEVAPGLVPNFEANNPKCASCDKSFGILGYVSAKLSGKVSEETQAARLDICKGCTAADTRGQKLYREIDGVAYCGLPRSEKVYRDDKQDGCGCDLLDKIQYRKSKCPKDFWGHAED